jgi:glycosyltransferase involved in cell wall biosynthesis
MAADLREIALFDFISHDTMHLPFNEEYLRVLRAAFPADRILFNAAPGHVANLQPRVADLQGIEFQACEPFTVPFGMSAHNPLGGRMAAHACRKTLTEVIADRPLRLAALLGTDANLYAVVGRHWPDISPAPLHMILHGQLGDAMIWRSRNPITRAADLVSQIQRPLPASVSLVALELGVKEAIAELTPVKHTIVTLEHPVLPSEWSDDAPPSGEGLKIAFLGNARRSKGFEIFVNLARTSGRDDLSFESIGVSAPDTDKLDIAALSRKPSRTSMSRQDYLEAVRAIDLVCLPLHGRAYDFTASGTVADAVSALKPLIAFRNRTLDAIFERYGPIGWLVDSETELFYLISTLDPRAFAEARTKWVENLKKMREARRPEALAASYAAVVSGSGG